MSGGSAVVSVVVPAYNEESRLERPVREAVVANEVESLQLESSWIKEYDPRFNVKYRDDKTDLSAALEDLLR